MDLDRTPAFRMWIDQNTQLLTEAKERGELLQHVDVAETAELLVGSFSGVQLLSQLRCQRQDLERRVVVLFEHFLPSITVPAVLARLDISVDRAERLLAHVWREGEAAVAVEAPVSSATSGPSVPSVPSVTSAPSGPSGPSAPSVPSGA
jgi:hypothetical protein